VLAWLRSGTTVSLPSPILAEGHGQLCLVLTDRRVMLVALSVVGDVWVESIDRDALEVSDSGLEVTIATRDRQLTSLHRNAELFREVLACASLQGSERLLEVARLNWLHRASNGLALCRSLLAAAVQGGNGLARAAAFLVAEALDESASACPALDPALDALQASVAPERTLAELWRSWDVSVPAALALIRALREYGARAEPWALALHAAVHSRARHSRRSVAATATADLDLAEHLIATARRSEAAELLEACLAELPKAATIALLAPSVGETSSGQDDRQLRSRAYELLAETRRDAQGADLAAVQALAQLHPLAVQRIQALATRTSGALRERAQRAAQLLEPAGLQPATVPEGAELRPLSEALLREVVAHPLTRADSPLLGKFQTLLALVPVPDYSALRDYCERLAPTRKSAALVALQQATRVLGTGEVEAFVSRGLKGVGLRSYEGNPPFILIGGQHLDPDSTYYLTPAQLRFAVGAEVAHLRFDHHRVTAGEVWAGAVSKGKEGLGLALGVLPVLKGWRVAERMARATARIPTGTFRKVVDAAHELNERVGAAQLAPAEAAPNRDVISALNEEFVVAHRVMQLTADRAGLLLAGDLHAAVRAMLLVRRDYHSELDTVQRDGLGRVLGQRAEGGHLAYLDLAIRVAALVSFYLSDDYAELTSALA
jgi:hypothetical protein